MTQPTSDQRRPFLSAPSPNRYFAAAATEEARQRIVRTIARSEGPAILVGAAGTGKSLLLAVLAEQFAPRMSVVTLAGAQLCTRKALLQMILCELGLPYRGLDEGELRLAILQHLRGESAPAGTKRTTTTQPAAGAAGRHRPDAATARPMLLLVDEADALPIRLLQELRVLTNIAADGVPLVRLVLAGGPILEERFAEPQLELFAQRIAARCYLAPLGREESMQYVRSQVNAVGVKPERLFTADALEAIYSATDGVPRLINQLGDQLVWMAEETGCAPLDGALVQQAWSDLQQLPAPWNTQESAAAASGSPTSGVIEFGELDAPPSHYSSAASYIDEPMGFAELDESEDEHPASIPIAAARPNRAIETLADDDIDASLEAAERLLDSFEEFEELEIRAADPEPAPADEPEPAAAENPFAEPFDEEEIVLDPYAAFESEMLRTAPQVINRLDRAFAGELHRCVQRASAQTPAAAKRTRSASDVDGDEQHTATVVKSQVRLHDSPAATAKPEAARELLIVEDDDQPAAAIIPGRQFRRLFSALEAAGGARATY